MLRVDVSAEAERVELGKRLVCDAVYETVVGDSEALILDPCQADLDLQSTRNPLARYYRPAVVESCINLGGWLVGLG